MTQVNKLIYLLWLALFLIPPAQAEWVDISPSVEISQSSQAFDRVNKVLFSYVTVTNNSAEAIVDPVRLVITNPSIPVLNAAGTTDTGDSYLQVVGGLAVGAKVIVRVNFVLKRVKLSFGVRVDIEQGSPPTILVNTLPNDITVRALDPIDIETTLEFTSLSTNKAYQIEVEQTILPAGLELTPIPNSSYTETKSSNKVIKQQLLAQQEGQYTIVTTATIIETGETATITANVTVLPAEELNPQPSPIGFSPAALVPNSTTEVTFSLRLDGMSPKVTVDVTLQNNEGQPDLALHDDGQNGDSLALDGIYTGVATINANAMSPEECLTYSALVNQEIETPDYKLCVTNFPIGMATSDMEKIITDYSSELPVSAIADELLIAFMEGTSEARIQEIVAENNAQVVGFLPATDVYQIKLTSQALTYAELNSLTTQLLSYSEVQFAEMNLIMEAASSARPNDPYLSKQEYLSQINAFEAWRMITGAYPVTILDTGIDASHPELLGKVNYFRDFVGESNNKTPYDNHGHGTLVASVIAAKTNNKEGIAGISPNSQLNVYKVCDRDKECLISWLLDGLDEALTHNDKLINISIAINLSKNFSRVVALCSSARKLYNAGAIIIASAGNKESEIKHYPAACGSVLGVGAKLINNETGLLSDDLEGSNYGYWVNIAAPAGGHGEIQDLDSSGTIHTVLQSLLPVPTNGYIKANIFGLDQWYPLCTLCKKDGYIKYSGSSISAAMVTGAASMVWTQNPSLTNNQVIDILKQTVTLFPEGEQSEVGAGLINIEAAVKKAYSFPILEPRKILFNEVVSPSIQSRIHIQSAEVIKNLDINETGREVISKILETVEVYQIASTGIKKDIDDYSTDELLAVTSKAIDMTAIQLFGEGENATIIATELNSYVGDVAAAISCMSSKKKIKWGKKRQLEEMLDDCQDVFAKTFNRAWKLAWDIMTIGFVDAGLERTNELKIAQRALSLYFNEYNEDWALFAKERGLDVNSNSLIYDILNNVAEFDRLCFERLCTQGFFSEDYEVNDAAKIVAESLTLVDLHFFELNFGKLPKPSIQSADLIDGNYKVKWSGAGKWYTLSWTTDKQDEFSWKPIPFIDATEYVLEDVDPSETYYFKLSTVNEKGERSLESEIFSTETGDANTWVSLLGIKNSTGNAIAADDSGNVYIAGTSIEPFPISKIHLFVSKFNKNGILQWTSQLVGVSSLPIGMSIDNAGDIVVVGSTASSTFEGDLNKGKHDSFIVKFDSNGNKLWSDLFGGLEADSAISVAIDSNGNSFVTGNTSSDVFYGDDNKGGQDVFIISYDSEGNVRWSQLFGSNGYDKVSQVKTDNLNNVYVVGEAYDIANRNDMFIVKYDNAGNKLWSNRMGGSGEKISAEIGKQIRIDSNSNVFVLVLSYSEFFDGHPVPLHGSTSYKGFFLVKFDSTGIKQWSIPIKDTNNNIRLVGGQAPSYYLDSNGDIYFYGNGHLNSFDGHPSLGSVDLFLMKFDENAVKQWSMHFGGSRADRAGSSNRDNNAIFVSGDYLYLTGKTYSPVFEGVTNSHIEPVQTNTQGRTGDAFIIKMLHTP